MARLVAALGPDPTLTLVQVGASALAAPPGAALGVVPHAGPCRAVGPFTARARDGRLLVAVGEVTLWDRAAVLAALPDAPAAVSAVATATAPAATRAAPAAAAPTPSASPFGHAPSSMSNPPGPEGHVPSHRSEQTCPTGQTPADLADGELLLRLYAHAGAAGLARARGMFALAIADGDELVLARDAVGARTMFYARAGATWLVASRLHPLRRWSALPRRVDLEAVRAFLTYAYVPGEATLLAGCRELLPGCVVRLGRDGRAVRESYWEPREGDPDVGDPAAHVAAVREALTRATAAMLPRGPVGVFLSGGIDSSAVTALAARLHDAPVRSYAISFGAGLPSELGYSSLVAAHCRTDHRILTFDGRQVADHLAEAVALLDSPVGDPLTVPNLLLARAAAADGLTVALNGEGGDPVLGGPKNLPMLFAELHAAGPDPAARARLYLRAYRKCHDDLPTLLTPAVHDALRAAPPPEALLVPYFAPGRRSYLDTLLHINLRTKGAHHILTKVERLTGSCGLEGRAPMFDREFVDTCFAVPPALKLRGTIEKWVLKEAVRDLLPATIVDRPKSGMRVPVQHWLRGPLRALGRDLLLSRRARERGLLERAPIERWLAGEGAVWPRQGGKLWLVLTLELWLRCFLDGEGAD